VWLTIVEVAERYNEIVGPWNQNGLKLNSARGFAVNTWRKMRLRPEDMLTEPVRWYELDYNNITETNFQTLVHISITRAGIAHGLALWFDAELIDGVGFSNAPGGEELIYGNAFFPFKEPVQVEHSDQFEIRLEARLIGDDYVWRWDTKVPDKTISFKQSTLLGAPLSPSQLRKRANSYVPRANDDGVIVRFVLSQIDGTNSLEKITTELVNQFPHRFADAYEAFDFVAAISEKYSV
jgi:protein arginine N-methyltransferase 1